MQTLVKSVHVPALIPRAQPAEHSVSASPLGTSGVPVPFTVSWDTDGTWMQCVPTWQGPIPASAPKLTPPWAGLRQVLPGKRPSQHGPEATRGSFRAREDSLRPLRADELLAPLPGASTPRKGFQFPAESIIHGKRHTLLSAKSKVKCHQRSDDEWHRTCLPRDRCAPKSARDISVWKARQRRGL